MNKKINIAVIGCGNRSQEVVKNLLRDSKGNVKITTVFDPDREVAKTAVAKWDSNETEICSSYQSAIDRSDIEWVMVFSPNSFHREHIVYAFEHDKHVFSEKPLATSIEDCLAINTAHEKSKKHFATGFVLRYAPIYRKAKEIINSGILGKLILIEANENIESDHGGYIMCNWRRHSKVAGPHILEKCCHDLDLIEWYVGDVPSRIAAFNGRAMFTDENKNLMQKYGAEKFMNWPDPHRVDTPFTSDSDLMDNLVSISEFRNQVRVVFSYTMSNIIPERRMSFNFTEGNLVLDLYKSSLIYRNIGEEEIHYFNFHGDHHAGGDDYIMKELYATMTDDAPPKCSGKEGLLSAVYAMAIDQAAVNGNVVDLNEIWAKLNI